MTIEYEDPRAKLADIMEKFKKAHADVTTHEIPAYEFIGMACVKLIDDMEGLLSLLCFLHETEINGTMESENVEKTKS